MCNLILSDESLFIVPGMAQTFVFIDTYRPKIPTYGLTSLHRTEATRCRLSDLIQTNPPGTRLSIS